MHKIADAEQIYRHWKRAKTLARLMDASFSIPGTRYRFGLDPLLGLIPGLGDAVGLAVSGYILALAWRMGLPKHRLALMVLNIVLDSSIGAVPVIGDLWDTTWKANLKNIAMVEKHLMKRGLFPYGLAPQKTRFEATDGPPSEQVIDVVAESHPSGRF